LEHHTQYGKYTSCLKLEDWAVGIAVGSRGEVMEIRPVTKDNNNSNKIIIIIIIIPNDKPGVIIRDNKQGTCMLIDIAIPGDKNMIKKEAENILKCKHLIIEIQRVWNVKAK
jgi:hypothetical protein